MKILHKQTGKKNKKLGKIHIAKLMEQKRL